MLRSAVDILVGKESERIAQAMVKKTIEGDVSGAGCSPTSPGPESKNKPPKKRYGPTEAELLAMEPQWEGPMEGDEDRDPPARPGCSLNKLPHSPRSSFRAP